MRSGPFEALFGALASHFRMDAPRPPHHTSPSAHSCVPPTHQVRELGLPVEVASMHSLSKGFLGECGVRGGYATFENFDPDVLAQVRPPAYAHHPRRRASPAARVCADQPSPRPHPRASLGPPPPHHAPAIRYSVRCTELHRTSTCHMHRPHAA